MENASISNSGPMLVFLAIGIVSALVVILIVALSTKTKTKTKTKPKDIDDTNARDDGDDNATEYGSDGVANDNSGNDSTHDDEAPQVADTLLLDVQAAEASATRSADNADAATTATGRASDAVGLLRVAVERASRAANTARLNARHMRASKQRVTGYLDSINTRRTSNEVYVYFDALKQDNDDIVAAAQVLETNFFLDRLADAQDSLAQADVAFAQTRAASNTATMAAESAASAAADAADAAAHVDDAYGAVDTVTGVSEVMTTTAAVVSAAARADAYAQQASVAVDACVTLASEVESAVNRGLGAADSAQKEAGAIDTASIIVQNSDDSATTTFNKILTLLRLSSDARDRDDAAAISEDLARSQAEKAADAANNTAAIAAAAAANDSANDADRSYTRAHGAVEERSALIGALPASVARATTSLQNLPLYAYRTNQVETYIASVPVQTPDMTTIINAANGLMVDVTNATRKVRNITYMQDFRIVQTTYAAATTASLLVTAAVDVAVADAGSAKDARDDAVDAFRDGDGDALATAAASAESSAAHAAAAANSAAAQTTVAEGKAVTASQQANTLNTVLDDVCNTMTTIGEHVGTLEGYKQNLERIIISNEYQARSSNANTAVNAAETAAQQAEGYISTVQEKVSAAERDIETQATRVDAAAEIDGVLTLMLRRCLAVTNKVVQYKTSVDGVEGRITSIQSSMQQVSNLVDGVRESVTFQGEFDTATNLKSQLDTQFALVKSDSTTAGRAASAAQAWAERSEDNDKSREYRIAAVAAAKANAQQAAAAAASGLVNSNITTRIATKFGQALQRAGTKSGAAYRAMVEVQIKLLRMSMETEEVLRTVYYRAPNDANRSAIVRHVVDAAGDIYAWLHQQAIVAVGTSAESVFQNDTDDPVSWSALENVDAYNNTYYVVAGTANLLWSSRVFWSAVRDDGMYGPAPPGSGW
jgi:uncharacterized membrane protein